ncbi:MAG: hypothetical protein A2Y73_05305 [Chloroflexi bacterium RBG_13_56_8]|nr:MAG: hypothetical protein A2Y73_05305 [Chloroflexi bacterium RBG_13_56_8]
MPKLWRVGLYEFKHLVFRKSFILAILSVPGILALIVGLTYIMESIYTDYRPIGYVDHAGVLSDPLPPPGGESKKDVVMIPYASEDDAKLALESGEIQAYYVLASDYAETRRVQLVYEKRIGENAERQFYDFLQINLLSDQPPEVSQRAAAGMKVTARTPDGSREFLPNPTAGQLMPLFVALALIYVVISTGGQLMGVLVGEKENRTVEILMTSVSPSQLMGGKVMGAVGANLTIMLVWVVLAVVVVFVGGNYLDIAWLRDLRVDAGTMWMVAAVWIPAYVFFGAIMAALGASLVDMQEAQQIAGLASIPMMFPLWLVMLYMENPKSPLGIALTLLPGTAPVATALRATFYPLPVWQVAVSTTIQTVCALGALWLAGRVFRLGMLRYSQRLNWREVVANNGTQVSQGEQHE